MGASRTRICSIQGAHNGSICMRLCAGEVYVMTATTGQAVEPPVTQQWDFWPLMGYAVILGVFGTAAPG
jgi:poly-gamma-glutamate capsule biosynthesis protein CapA/YwtB (metallophosphatase superfamily)